MIEDEEREREKEKGRFDGAHLQRMCMYIDPWTISTSDQRVRIQHLSPPLHLATLSSLALFLSLSLSLSFFVLISLASRSLPFLFSRAPPRDNNYPFDFCARRSQSHDSSSCHFPLCRLRPSIERYLQSIIPLPCPTRLIDNLPWCIISAGLSINS